MHNNKVVVDGCFSAWKYITSRAPQGYILGLLFFFVIYVNNLNEYGCGNNTNNGEVIDNEESCLKVQKDIDQLDGTATDGI